MEKIKLERAAEEQRNRENGTPGDVDFQRMIRVYRQDQPPEQPHVVSDDEKICICVRKRPISSKEINRRDYDSITCLNPVVVVHDCKLRVDGISKYLDSTSFEVDHTFHEDNSTEEVYAYVVKPLVDFVLKNGHATVFAYGQTGSGKTYTMQGIQNQMVDDLFLGIEQAQAHTDTQILVSYFEIYGGRCQDLLNNRNRLNVREDGNGEVVVADLMEVEAVSAEELHGVIDTGNKNRTTHATESNDESSRSHAICQISLRSKMRDRLLGKFSLIDLAGSERGADTKSHNRQRRMEGAEINKSLLALKECIRALDGNSSHVPYRASKLTLVLKDSFTRSQSRTVMIANISPAASSADHTLNTLRYADRIKERVVGAQAKNNKDGGVPTPPPAALLGRPCSESKAAAAAKPTSKAIAAGSKEVSPMPPPPAAPPKAANGREPLRRDALNLNEELQLDDDIDELHRTVQDLFEEEEALLNLHMNIIQENAELLTEEGRLLQQIQTDDGDIDEYATRLENILERKQELVVILKQRLSTFRGKLRNEEMVAAKATGRLPNF